MKSKDYKKTKKTKKKRQKKLDDLKNQNLKIIFEDITSHKRKVREIEELTFQQLLNLRKQVTNAMKLKIPLASAFDEEDELEKQQELEEKEEEKKEEE